MQSRRGHHTAKEIGASDISRLKWPLSSSQVPSRSYQILRIAGMSVGATRYEPHCLWVGWQPWHSIKGYQAGLILAWARDPSFNDDVLFQTIVTISRDPVLIYMNCKACWLRWIHASYERRNVFVYSFPFREYGLCHASSPEEA